MLTIVYDNYSLSARMVSKSKKILGLIQSREFGERDILKSFRNKVKSDQKNLMELSEAALTLMKMYEKESIGLKLVDEIYNDMIEGSNLSADNQKVELFLRGFKPISHKGIFAILKKKYGKNEGCSFELNDCEIVLTHVTLPNDRSGLPHKFPPLKIKIHSTINHVKFDLCGESAVLFVLFYLKTIL